MSTHSQSTIEIPQVVANPRVVETVQPILGAIGKAITDSELTYDEWRYALGFMMKVCESKEMPLLMNALFENIVDANANRMSTSSTSAIQGPYHVPGAPEVGNPGALPQRPHEPGDPLIFSGTVSSENGHPLAGAVVDVWHADASVPGSYSNVHPGQPDFNLRGQLKTDGEGRFEVRTIKPAPYPIPDQGPTGRLLNALGRHSWRPAHIHCKVSAAGHAMLTTQLYFAGDEFLDSDSVNGVKDDLIIALEDAGDAQRLKYDFVLQQSA